MVLESWATHDEFQSAPPAETRGDTLFFIFLHKIYCFNPLPPPKRGETSLGYTCDVDGKVSIRSPRRNEGRHDFDLLCDTIIHGFNPLPPPKRGETL